jgi:Ricin-type beta-trefoil lectin domain-like
VTVYRNFDPSTMYKICNRMSGLCLDVAPPGGEAGDGAPILEANYDSTFLGQKWILTMPSPGQYRVTNFATGLVLSSSGSSVMLHSFAGAPSQLWAFRSMADGTGYDQILPLGGGTASLTAPNNGSTTAGQTVVLSEWLYNDAQKWVLSIAD